MHRILYYCLLSFALLSYAASAGDLCEAGEAHGGEWNEFRNGGSSHAAGEFPVVWSPESGIAWQKELPGYGQSSPVISDSRVYLTAVSGPMKDELVVICLDLKTGQQLWKHEQSSSTPAASSYMASRAAPTPVADSSGIIAFFESGDVVALNPSGEVRWKRSLTADYGMFDNNHGLGCSPAQTKDAVIINIEHRGPSYLLALDKATGTTRWKTERHSGSSWTSPIVMNADGRETVVVSSGGTVDTYDSADGHLIWTLGGLGGNTVPSPTAVGPYLFVGARIPEFGDASSAAQSNMCIRLDSDPAQPYEVVWRAAKAVCDYASPVVDRDCIYFLNNVGVLYCLDSTTGEPHYTERLGAACWATPVVAGENVLFFGKDGRTHVIRSGPVFARVATNDLWDPANPPKPETYSEHTGGSPAGGSPAGGSPAGESRTGAAESRRGPPGGMAAILLKGDTNGDGSISRDELPAEFVNMLPRIDTNQDGVVDAAELKAMDESFRKRREGSRDSARDPIVYGVAAADGAFVIRTGTRVYSVRGARFRGAP